MEFFPKENNQVDLGKIFAKLERLIENADLEEINSLLNKIEASLSETKSLSETNRSREIFFIRTYRIYQKLIDKVNKSDCVAPKCLDEIINSALNCVMPAKTSVENSTEPLSERVGERRRTQLTDKLNTIYDMLGLIEGPLNLANRSQVCNVKEWLFRISRGFYNSVPFLLLCPGYFSWIPRFRGG